MATQKQYFDRLRAEGKEKAKLMLADFRLGNNLEQTGALWGVTRQRVHQLLTQHFPAEYRRARK